MGLLVGCFFLDYHILNLFERKLILRSISYSALNTCTFFKSQVQLEEVFTVLRSTLYLWGFLFLKDILYD